MKKLVWYRDNALIPADAKYLTTKEKITGWVCDDTGFFNDEPIKELFHLYEVKTKSKKENKCVSSK